MPGKDASSGLQVGLRSGPRARLLACFVFALGAHSVVLAAQPVRKPVASRRSAGGLLSVELDQRPAESPPAAPPFAATAAPVARRPRNTAGAVRSPAITRAAAHDEPQPASATETTSPLVGLLAGIPSAIANGFVVETERPASQGRTVALQARTVHGRPHGPHLLTAGVCAGFFPSQARDDDGAVIVALSVRESGATYAPRVISEAPPRQGFGSAALHCASFLKFDPAESAAGAHVLSTSVVRLRFARVRAK